MRTLRPSHAFFALTLIAFGILGLVQRDFMPTWGGVGPSLSARVALVYATALLSLVCGIGLLWPRTAVAAARALLAAFAVWLLLIRVPVGIRTPISVGNVWGCADTAVLLATAWVLSGDKGFRIARVLFGLAVIVFGLAHFAYLDRTAPLVPAWLPWHTAWAYFTGGAFIAAGIAVLTGVLARLGATLVTLQMALFTLLVWVPIVTAHPKPFDWTEFFSSWALSAAGWVIADSYRGTPWLGGRAP